MSNNLTANICVSFFSTYSKTVGSQYASFPLRITKLLTLVNGDAAGGATRLYASLSATLNVGASAAFDLVGGPLLDAFGDAVNWTKLKAIIIVNETTGNQPISVTSTIAGVGDETLGSGEFIVRGRSDAAGMALSAGADTITIANGDGSTATYTIALIGV